MKASNEEVRDRIYMEGLEYTIRHYYSPKNLEDKKLARLFRDAIEKIENYLHIEY